MYFRLSLGFILTALILILKIPTCYVVIPYLILGYDVLLSSAKKIIKGKFFDEEFLMSIATIGAIILGEYTEAAAVMFFYQAGELLGHRTSDRCRDSIREMFDFAPDKARRITESGFEIVAPEDLKPNDKITVLAGEKIPCDGFVYSGDSFADTSSLTGESLPVHIADGAKVFGGTINLNSPINIRVTAKYKDSSVAKVIKLLEEASKNKAHSEKFITAFAKKYTPVVVILSLLAAIILPLFPAFTIRSGIYTALMFLVISCPCSLVISVPLTLFAGIGNASRNKILFKGNNSLESLFKIKSFAFDKTGTLTTGSFSVSRTTLSEEDFELLAQAERFSTHPLARIISQHAKPPFAEAFGTTEIKGMGIIAKINGHEITAGNDKLFEMKKIPGVPKINGTAVHLAVDGIYKGYVLLSDNIKTDSAEVLSILKSKGAEISLLSGDSYESVKSTAEAVGIKNYRAELLPEDKVEALKELKSKSPVVYVGDGINDAPVLNLADIGISMGGAGSDIAIASSDIILLDDSLKSLEKAIKISKKTMRILYQNIVLSIGIKAVIMILSLFGISNMTLAVFADVGVMILTVLNSIRAMR